MKRVVITGLGLITPIGLGRRAFWRALLEGKSGVGPVTSFDTTDYPVHLGAEVKEFDARKYVTRQPLESMGRGSHLGVAAARLAVEDAGLDLSGYDRRRVGVCMGTTSGEPRLLEQYNDIRQARGLDAIPGEIPRQYPCHVIPSNIAIELELRGPSLMIPTACAAGNYAIGYGMDLIRAGEADLMLAGGADPFSRITYMGFARLGAIAPDCCQPFDKNRKGMIPGEGAAVLVLEPLDAAQARGAKIYAEVLGYGLSCDAHHMTAAHPQGDGAIRAMAMALRESGLDPAKVDYISAHGTGTHVNDRIETLAVRSLFGDHSPHVPMSSIKSMLGHMMGAASAIEAAACALALDCGTIPPTINYHEPDPDCEWDFVPNVARQTHPRVALNNAYAFGGNNASLCLARCPEKTP
jgi:3-oxoacyl-[acyl-carrier-protein] synthase II